MRQLSRLMILAVGFVAIIGTFASAGDTYDVAAFYWPSCHFDERWAKFFPDGSQGEWESIRNCKPKWDGHYQPRVPAWGYLMDNDPAAMEKKIDAATSHGVNVMIFDWYWFENKPFLESALNDGFLKAKNVDKMKFYLMWANHDATTAWDIRRSHERVVIWPGSVDLPTFKTIVARVIRKYFSHPSYYKIDGKPLFSIYDMNNLLKGLGGIKQTVEALDYFRSEVKKAGFPGLHIQMIYWGRVPKIDDSGFASKEGTTANTIKTFKIDSVTNYQFVHLARPEADYVKWADKALSNWPKWSKEFDVPYFPHVSIGWDNNARFVEKRRAVTDNVNPETFKKYLLKAKAYADAHPDQPKLITINAWNEWVEGSYLEPDERFGMGYLQAVKDVFVPPAKDRRLGRQTMSYGVKLADDKPAFTEFWLDSLGKGRKWPSAILAGNLKQTYRKESSNGWINYYPAGQPDARTRFKFDEKSFRIRSEAKADNAVEPFVLKFKADGPNPAYATLLGKIRPDGSVKSPAVLHIPGQGTMRISAKSATKETLYFGYSGKKHDHIAITFPAASKKNQWIDYELEVINVYPPAGRLEGDRRFDGYRRCWLNALQLSYKHQVMANHAASDVCGFIMYVYSEIAMLSGDLAEGVSGPQLIRDSVDIILAGKKTYGMPGYRFGDYPITSLDTWPSLLICAHNYYQSSGDDAWVKKNIDKLLEWGNESIKTDSNGNGLIEFHQSGNIGECRLRPANWWDCINFGHEDAYSNALAYRGFRGLAKMAKNAGKKKQAKKFAQAAKKLKSSYYKTFYNPKTQMLAGWKSKDGQLHDYNFTFIQGIAITYGLIDDEKKANDLLDTTLKKMKEVGFDRFDLGLPGNLVNVPQEDYYECSARWGGSNAFQVYENGGASANHAYFFIAALYKLGRQEDGDRILLPMLNSFDNCRFQGRNPGEKYTNDWLAWDGKPHGYEGILVDGYLVAKAVLVRQGLVDPQWGIWKKYSDGRPAATLRMDAKDQGIILTHGDGPDECDVHGAREALIFKENDVYHLFYDGAGPSGWLACLATSKDLINWEKKGPVLDFGKPGEMDSAHACSPWVYKEGNEWHMFYLGTPNGKRVPSFPYVTMKAKSRLLAGPWVKQKNVVPFSPKPNTYYSLTASPGHVVKNGDQFLQFFSSTTRKAGNKCVQRTLGIARTKDLDGAWAVDPKPMVPIEEQVENSSLYYEKSNKTWFLFTNHIGIDGGEYTDAVWVYWSRDLNKWNPKNKAVVLDGKNCKWSTKCIGMPSVIQVGKRLAIFYDAPGRNSVNHLNRNIGLAWLDLPLSPAKR